jgi:multiple sugar transport system permease protein
MIVKRSNIRVIWFHILCIPIALVMLYPVLWMISSSLKESAQVFVHAHSLIPDGWHFENYARGWKGFAGNTFAVYFKNSLIISFLSVLGALLSSSLIAYGFARIKFKFKKFWFATVIMSMLLPGEIIRIPQYIIFYKLHWINTFLPLVVPGFFGGAFFVFLIMQFIRTLPYELDEAAKIDGCNRFVVYYRIILPLITSVLVTTAIFDFYWSWDNFMGALIYLGKPHLYTVSVAIRLFADPGSQTDWSAMFAMATLSLSLPVAVFFIFQRYIVEGISTTGLKG